MQDLGFIDSRSKAANTKVEKPHLSQFLPIILIPPIENDWVIQQLLHPIEIGIAKDGTVQLTEPSRDSPQNDRSPAIPQQTHVNSFQSDIARARRSR